jgi:hypothetical protein
MKTQKATKETKKELQNEQKNTKIEFTNLIEEGDKIAGIFNGFIETKFGFCIVINNNAMHITSDLKKIIINNKYLFLIGSKIEITLTKIVKLKGRKTYKVYEVNLNGELLTSQTTNIVDTNDLPF